MMNSDTFSNEDVEELALTIEQGLLEAMSPSHYNNDIRIQESESELYPDGYELTVTLYIGLGHDELLEVLDALMPHDTRSVDMTIFNLHVDLQESGRRRVHAVIGVDDAEDEEDEEGNWDEAWADPDDPNWDGGGVVVR